jgi:F-type H+-transporting ATPase subunit delta
MKASKLARREAKQLFRSCLIDGVLDDNRARQAVQRVLEARPRGYLAILSVFHRLVKLDVQRRTATIESAVALSQELQARVTADLLRVYGPGLSVSASQKEALIGGLRIKVGSDVYDGSVRARLAALEASF